MKAPSLTFRLVGLVWMILTSFVAADIASPREMANRILVTLDMEEEMGLGEFVQRLGWAAEKIAPFCKFDSKIDGVSGEELVKHWHMTMIVCAKGATPSFKQKWVKTPVWKVLEDVARLSKLELVTFNDAWCVFKPKALRLNLEDKHLDSDGWSLEILDAGMPLPSHYRAFVESQRGCDDLVKTMRACFEWSNRNTTGYQGDTPLDEVPLVVKMREEEKPGPFREMNLTVACVGNGTLTYRAMFEVLRVTFGLSKKVIFKGGKVSFLLEPD